MTLDEFRYVLDEYFLEIERLKQNSVEPVGGDYTFLIGRIRMRRFTQDLKRINWVRKFFIVRRLVKTRKFSMVR